MKDKVIQYCAVGDYGLEANFDTEEECRAWIKKQYEDEAGFFENEEDYYQIQTFTQAEIDAMPEI